MKEGISTYWHKFVGSSGRSFSAVLQWLPILFIVGFSTGTLFLWRSLNVNNHPQTEQTSELDVVPVTKPTTTANIKPSSDQLVFAGSGVSLEITRLLAAEFRKSHPNSEINVPESIGSTGAIQAAADGTIAVGMISRPLKEQEKKLGLTVVPYAQTATVLTTHPTVVDDGLTSEDLIQIYRGTKTQWQDGKEIIVLTREVGDTSIVVLEKIPGFKEVFRESDRAKRWTTLYTDQEMNQTLAKTPYAIGFADLGTIAAERLSSIKVMKFNSVAPTLENVANGKYPLVKQLAFVYQKEKLLPNAKAFLNFILSKDGEKILKANGYLPVK